MRTADSPTGLFSANHHALGETQPGSDFACLLPDVLLDPCSSGFKRIEQRLAAIEQHREHVR
jgi:hypothetical protein